jgi:TonB family protein
MKLKVIISLICCAIYVGQCLAQDNDRTSYHKNSGQQVASAAEADFSRVITGPEEGSKLYSVTEYYKDNVKKLTGKSSMPGPIIYEGEVVTYYPLGQKQEVVSYLKGKKSGAGYKYFPNGKLYVFSVHQTEDRAGMKEMIMDCNDITGKEIAKNGIGYYIGYNSDFGNVVEEGPLKASLRDGSWKGNNDSKEYRVDFTEQYKEGILTEGKSIDRDGKTYTYTERYVMPQYTGGLQEFGAFLGSNIKYPAKARNNKIQGAVYLGFVVQADGSLTDFKVIKSPDQELSDEAIRVLKSTPSWIPGKMYGKAVRVSYTVPIRFTL